MAASNWLKTVEAFEHFRDIQLRMNPNAKFKLSVSERHSHIELIVEAFKAVYNEQGEKKKNETLERKTLFVGYKDSVQGETELLELYDFLTKEYLNTEKRE